MKVIAKVRKLGRIVIPSEIREFYEIQEGDIVEFIITKVKHPNGIVINLPQKEGIGGE